MGIRRLEISGYRSLADVVWEPGPLNLLIGANGSGKSNLLRALNLLRAAMEGKLSETVLRAGGMVPILWDGRTHSIHIGIMADNPAKSDGKSTLTYHLKLEQVGHSGSFIITNESVLATINSGQNELSLLSRIGNNAEVYTDVLEHATFIEPLITNERESALSQIIYDTVNNEISQFRGQLSEIRVYHDVRVDTDSEIRRAAVTRLEEKIDQDGANLVAVLHTLYSSERTFREDLNMAMRAAFGEEFEELIFPPAEDGRVQLRLRWRSLKHAQSAADLSDGTLRFLFLITVLANPIAPSLIAIDEPETGLHPSMFPIVAEYAIEAAKRTQVILTTHSPQFLNAFSEFPDITTVAESHEGKTVLRRLPADKLARWLEHYQLGELMVSGELETME